jgi:uncharacterized membrane protein
MDKRKFLEILKQTLNGEVTSDIIEQNVKYYDQYISAQTVEEEMKILELLGDPRLIARTIIETDKAARQKGKFNGNQRNYAYNYANNYSDEEAENFEEKSSNSNNKNIFKTNLKWYHKLLIVFVILIIIILIVFIGRLIIGFLFAFGLPIILVLLIMSLFRRR